MTVDSLQIFAGQRYSFVLTANQPVGNYWIRANPNVGTTGFENGLNSAILRYVGAPTIDPTSTQTGGANPLLETSLSPLKNPGVPGAPVQGGADIDLHFNIIFNTTDQRFWVNGATFIPPSVPVLLQILSGAGSAQELLPSGSIYVLPRGKSVEVSLTGSSSSGPVSLNLFQDIKSVQPVIYSIQSTCMA
jgi:iron transport multicopper oxidase